MEEQHTEEGQTDSAPQKKKHVLALTISICGILIVLIGLAGYYLGNSQKKTTAVPISLPTLATSPSPTTIPASGFAQFVQLFGQIVPILTNSQFEQLAVLQPQTEITCNDEAPYNPTICQGQPNGTTVSGYTIGYEASEGSIYSHDQFIQTLNSYVAEHGPFTYGSNQINGDTASITLYNAARDWKLAVVLNNDNPEHLWKIQYTLLGVNLE